MSSNKVGILNVCSVCKEQVRPTIIVIFHKAEGMQTYNLCNSVDCRERLFSYFYDGGR